VETEFTFPEQLVLTPDLGLETTEKVSPDPFSCLSLCVYLLLFSINLLGSLFIKVVRKSVTTGPLRSQRIWGGSSLMTPELPLPPSVR